MQNNENPVNIGKSLTYLIVYQVYINTHMRNVCKESVFFLGGGGSGGYYAKIVTMVTYVFIIKILFLR